MVCEFLSFKKCLSSAIDVKSMINVDSDNTDDYLTVMQDLIDNIRNICLN